MISLLKKYILPKEVDFLSALQTQSKNITTITQNLYECFIKKRGCNEILKVQNEASIIRDKNMQELLNVFITQIDRESIYRVITQLDWIALSIKHLYLESRAYQIDSLAQYKEMLYTLNNQANYLYSGFLTLQKDNNKTAQSAKKVRDDYDKLVEIYIQNMAKLTKSKDIKYIFIQKEILHQLKDISKRFRIAANSLEDIVMKMA